MTARSRLAQILASFDLSRPVRKPAELMRELGVSRASIYRDLGELEQAGLLERVPGRGYALGPLIVELDRQIRLADPLINAAGSLLRALADDVGGTVLLCRVHAGKVLCVHQEHGAGAARSSYERGRAMPLYRGATSKVILAHLPPAQLRELWRRDAAFIAAAGMPNEFEAFQRHLETIRAKRICVAANEVDSGLQGFAAPLLDGPRVLGSLSVVIPLTGLGAVLSRRIQNRLGEVAAAIEARIENQRAVEGGHRPSSAANRQHKATHQETHHEVRQLSA